MADIFHVFGLHMHQPPGNLKFLAQARPEEGQQIMLCYARPLKYAQRYRDVGRIVVGFSGILLEQLQDPEVARLYADIVDIPKMLEAYAEAQNIELVGMGYSHPIFPLIPKGDWEVQVEMGKAKIKEVFGREALGFWPSEMAFMPEMIPVLKKNGYRYVILEGMHLATRGGGPWSQENILYQPHTAELGTHQIAVIPRDRNLSNAHQRGMDPSWFVSEVKSKTAGAPRPAVVTTWTDGENSAWLRQTQEEKGFWGSYFVPYMEKVRSGEIAVEPVLPGEFLHRHPPRSEVEIEIAVWNLGTHGGFDLSRWSGSEAQKRAISDLAELSRAYHRWRQGLDRAMLKGAGKATVEAALDLLRRVEACLLRAETSCYLFWGEDWIARIYEEIRPAQGLLRELALLLSEKIPSEAE